MVNEMRGHVECLREKRNYTKFWSINLKLRNRLEDFGVNL